MKRMLNTLVLAVAISSTAFAGEVESVDAKIETVGLFKNGYLLVTRKFTVNRSGIFRLGNMPEPVHGTFWVEGPVETEVRVGMEKVRRRIDFSKNPAFTSALVGKEVRITLIGRDPIVSGIVESAGTGYRDSDAADYENDHGAFRGRAHAAAFRCIDDKGYLVVRTEDKRMFIRLDTVALIEASGTEDLTVEHECPVMTIGVKEVNGPVDITITYLARGAAWAPSYKLDISDPKVLRIVQKAVIRNEFEDLQDAGIFLISGFPNVKFLGVKSPLDAKTSWAAFFAQLRSGSGQNRNEPVLGQVVSNVAWNRGNDRADDFNSDEGVNPAGDGPDIRYQPVGKRTVKKGETLAFVVQRGEVEYEKITEWEIRDALDKWNRWRESGPDSEDDVWDAIRFKNPFDFSMTTGPASFFANGRFLGQSMSFWTDPGERVIVRITKALKVRVAHVEQEQERSGETMLHWGSKYRRSTVRATMKIVNHKGEDVRLVIGRKMSGELLKAEGDPRKSARSTGVYAVNREQELTWEVTLKPGERKTITYEYVVLIRV